jgi:hypothetical protein
VRAQNGRFRAAEVKAAFLFNFLQFVTWPDDALGEPQSPFVVGVLGEDPFGPVLDEVVKDEHVRGHSIAVVRFHRVEDVGPCHVLYMGPMSPEEYARAFELLDGRPILTVGDTAAFASQGGTIRFVTERNRIRLSINLDGATKARLTVSSNLLRGSEVVGDGGPR